MKRIIPLLLLAVLATSCRSGKDAAMNDLMNLRTEVQENAMSYNFNQWIKQEKKFEKICERMDKYEYTPEEHHEIGKAKGELVGYFAKGVMGKASNKIIDAAEQIQGIIDGIKNALKP